MVSLIDTLDLSSAEARRFMEGVQGNILKGHGRNHSKHIFLTFKGDKNSVKKWIFEFANTKITTEYQSFQMRLFRKNNESDTGEPFAMFLLSYAGYKFLEFEDQFIPKPGGPVSIPVHDQYFKRGMKMQASLSGIAGARFYNDPPVDEWEAGYQEDIHALAILSDDDRVKLEQELELFKESLPNEIRISAIETGRKLKAKFAENEHDIEHFGFTDGISQPLLVQQDVDTAKAKLGDANWNPAAPLQLTFVKEPHQNERYGSFLVFRKLEQNVKQFWSSLGELSKQLGIDIEVAGAMATGRKKDGTPLVNATGVADGGIQNDFNFSSDTDGLKCPFHAHIRKVNPRGDMPRQLGGTIEFERALRIVRRGVTYGNRPDLVDENLELPEVGVGLLFICFQSNLEQFVIQQEGSDSNDFVQSYKTGPDPIIGRNKSALAQSWPSGSDKKFAMANFVKMLGGNISSPQV